VIGSCEARRIADQAAGSGELTRIIDRRNGINNLISGILLLAERPLRMGDIVTIGSATGDVTRIGIRSLTVLTSEQKEVIIPNSAVISESFTNWTKSNDTLRDVLTFRVSFFDNAEHAAELITEAARSTDGVLASPAPKATISELTDIGISIRLQYFIHGTGPFWEIRDSVLRDALEALATEGFTIPTVSINETAGPLRVDRPTGSSHRAAAIRCGARSWPGYAEVQRRHPVRPDPGGAAADPSLAARIRGPFLSALTCPFRMPSQPALASRTRCWGIGVEVLEGSQHRDRYCNSSTC
jgi:hypothetical protein